MNAIVRNLPHNRALGTVFNNDSNNILHAMDADNPTVDDYRRALNAILDARPGVLAQCVGLPEAVAYPTDVDNTFEKHLLGVTRMTWNDADAAVSAERQVNASRCLRDAGTDVLSLTIDACRERDVSVVADYRMNAEDWYDSTYLLSDFGRAHPEWRIPFTEEERQRSIGAGNDPPHTFAGCLDPASPGVLEHRLAIFSEVARNYDVDGIEFDFRRWCHMISNPLENHPILTRLVRRTREMLDDVARAKKRDRMLLGVRVGPSLDDPPGTEYPGGRVHNDFSCRLLGLDVATWIDQEFVDYVSPTLFWPRWPGLPKTREFVALAKDRNVGVYPTLFPLPAWLEEDSPIEPTDTVRLSRYKNELCRLALDLYADNADGISTFNWYFHLFLAEMPTQWQAYYGYGAAADVQQSVLSVLADPNAIRRYLEDRASFPDEISQQSRSAAHQADSDVPQKGGSTCRRC